MENKEPQLSKEDKLENSLNKLEELKIELNSLEENLMKSITTKINFVLDSDKSSDKLRNLINEVIGEIRYITDEIKFNNTDNA